jgi:DNA-binding MarR family transcriptional regulator
MEVLVGGRSASEMPGLDIAEMRSWQHFLEAAVRMSAMLNRGLVASHKLTLNDVRLLDMLNKSVTGSARMGDVAEELMSLPSRVTRQIRRLETEGLVRREASPHDRRGVLATITDEGRATVDQAMRTYGHYIKTHFLSQLSRPQVAALGENCRRINHGLKVGVPPTRLARG